MDTDLIAETIENIKKSPKKNGEALFVAHLEDIKKMLSLKISIKMIWKTLNDKGLFPAQYNTFRKYIHLYSNTLNAKKEAPVTHASSVSSKIDVDYLTRSEPASEVIASLWHKK